MKQLLALVGAALASAALAQASVTWSVPPGGLSIATDAAENVYTVNWEYAPAGDIVLTKHNAAGTVLYSVRYDNVDSTRHEVATWVDTDSTGGAYVSGTIRSGYSNPVNANALLMRFASDGTLRWRRVLGADFDGAKTVKVVVDAADNAYVLGLGPTSGGFRTRIQKLDASGNLLWTWADALGVGAPVNLKWAADGTLVVSARTVTGQFAGFARVDRDGQTLWLKAGVPAFAGADAAGDAAGNVVTATIDPATSRGLLQKFASNGALLWSRTDVAALSRVEVGPDGSVVASGMPNTGSSGVVFLKFSPDGTAMWANRDADGPAHSLLAHGQMRLDAAGNGYLAASNMSQIGVVRVNANGTAGWTLLAPFGYGYALSFGASSNALYVVGGQTVRIDQASGPPPPPSADLAVTVADTPDPAKPGQDIVLTTKVSNSGVAVAEQVFLNQNQSGTVTGVSSSTTQGSCSGVRPLVCSLGSIAPGAVVTVTQTVRTRTVGTLTTTATVTTSTADPVTANNTATTTTTVRRR